MLKQFKLKPFFLVFLIMGMCSIISSAQETIVIDDNLPQQFFTFKQIEVYKDQSNKLTFNQVSNASFNNNFHPSLESAPQANDLNTTYWFRIKIKHNEKATNNYLLELYDQTIDHLTAYIPQKDGSYKAVEMGDMLPFSTKILDHKNFEILLKNDHNQESTYYFKVRSSQIAAGIIVLRSYNWFIHYALNEYFYFGIYYGMILVFSFYNLMMFIAMREKQYLYYVLYILSVAIFEMSNDGIAFQYLWPNSTRWNQVSFAYALCAISVFALLFTKEFLHVKRRSVKLDRIITFVIIARILFLVFALLFARDLLTYKFLDFIPLMVAFLTGLYVQKQGYLPARFFVLGYTCLFVGFMIKLAIMLYFPELNHNAIGYYSLSFCFVLEMIFLSFAIGDKVRILRKKKEQAQVEMITQMAENAELKDSINLELEQKVEERTGEVFLKSKIIEAKNEELEKVNNILMQQATEIERMNYLLEQDNKVLQRSVKKITQDRVMSADVDFEEFSKIYPDKEQCNLFLAELKWKNGFICKRCRNAAFYNGHIPFSRRCTKCSYEESVTSYTIFQNTRIPINKAFYMVFLVFSSKGKISSHKLAEILNIRQSTCWTYGAKIKAIMEERKTLLKKTNKNGWSLLVLD